MHECIEQNQATCHLASMREHAQRNETKRNVAMSIFRLASCVSNPFTPSEERERARTAMDVALANTANSPLEDTYIHVHVDGEAEHGHVIT
jgi:multidrug resistance efflux pump